MPNTLRTLGTIALATTALLSVSVRALAQTAPNAPVARAGDVATPDAIIAAVYESISGPAGQPRDWTRFRSPMIPGARLIPSPRRTPGTTTPVVWSADEYIAAVGPALERQGFFERELHRTTDAFGSVMHAFSTSGHTGAIRDPSRIL